MYRCVRKTAAKGQRAVLAIGRLSAFPAPRRPLVLIHSDDWGRVGIPSLAVMERLQRRGVAIGKSLWDYYGIESNEDLERLGEALSEVRDGDGRSAVVSAVFIMANADLGRIRKAGFQEFYSIPISKGLPEPWSCDCVFSGYQNLVAQNVFSPSLHGYVHFNVDLFLRIGREDSERGELLRTLTDADIPYLASLTPEINFALVCREGGNETPLGRKEQAAWINDGVVLFEEAFGVRPVATCAPGYRADVVSLDLWQKQEIKVVHCAACRFGPEDGVWRCGRNAHFEPVFDADARTKAFLAAKNAVSRGQPIVISSHSINYLSRYLERAHDGVVELSRLLNQLVAEYPDLRFMTDQDLYRSWESRDPEVWRNPTASEVTRRMANSVGRV